MKRFDAKSWAVIGVILAAILFIAVNIISNTWLTNLRLDLTQGHAYTTSSQIKPIFQNIKEPIVVRVYYSTPIGEVSPRHAVFYQRVRDLLQQYAKLSQGKIKVEYFDPQPYSDVEDRAVGYGLQGIPMGSSGE